MFSAPFKRVGFEKILFLAVNQITDKRNGNFKGVFFLYFRGNGRRRAPQRRKKAEDSVNFYPASEHGKPALKQFSRDDFYRSPLIRNQTLLPDFVAKREILSGRK